MKIRTKLMLMFSLLIILILGVVFVNYYTYLSLDSDANFVNSAGRLRAWSFRMAQLSANIVIEPQNSEYKSLLEEKINSFDKMIAALIDGNDSMELKAVANNETAAQLTAIQTKWNDEFKPAYLKLMKNDSSSLSFITKAVEEYVKQIDTMVSDYSSFSQAKVGTAKLLSISSFIIAILIGVLSLIVIRTGIIAPINAVIKGLEEISSGDGDLTKELTFKANNEIGMLTKLFNGIVANIRDIIITISKSSSGLSGAMNEISGTSEELAKSTEMIAMAIQDVSEGSMSQSDMVKGLNRLVSDLNYKITEVMQKADNLLSQSEKTKLSSQAGNETINKEVEELKQLVDTTNEVSNTVNKLEQHSGEINSILTIIEAISSQINLLALNASIEAARAGDAGKGFAVVANEVRKLAEETAKSTIGISDIVKNITAQTKGVKTSMDAMLIKIDKQVESMTVISSKLSNIYYESIETYTESERILEINKSIGSDFKVITDSANQISEVVGRNTQNTQDVAAAVQEQTATFEEVSANLSSLSEMSNELKGIVAKFKI